MLPIGEQAFMLVLFFLFFLHVLSGIAWLWDGTIGSLIDILKWNKGREIYFLSPWKDGWLKYLLLRPIFFTMILQFYGFSKKRKLYICILSIVGSLAWWSFWRFDKGAQ